MTGEEAGILFIGVTIQQVLFREVFFVNKVHRKPENCGAKSCKA